MLLVLFWLPVVVTVAIAAAAAASPAYFLTQTLDMSWVEGLSSGAVAALATRCPDLRCLKMRTLQGMGAPAVIRVGTIT